MDERRVISRVVRRTVRRRAVRRCGFCGGPARPGVEGRDVVICAACIRAAYAMLLDPPDEPDP